MRECTNCEFCSEESEDQCTLRPGFGDPENCEHYTEKEHKMTNREKLNNMSNAEIAIFMMARCKCEDCPAKKDDCRPCKPAQCVDNWITYLESEVK